MSISQHLVEFEQRVARQEWPLAFEDLARFLRAFAQEDEAVVDWCHQVSGTESAIAMTRLAAAITTLMANPATELTSAQFRRLTCWAADLAHVFVVSGYRNTDHILAQLLARGTRSPEGEFIFANSSDARKFLLCSTLYGNNVESLIDLLRRAPQAALTSALATLAAHVTCDETAQRNRNQLLDALELAKEVTPAPMALVDLHRAWTLCSYATTEHRHQTKRPLNKILKNWLRSQDLSATCQHPLTSKERPTLLVACEVTGGGHVMSRCYEPFLEQLREKFRVVTMVAKPDLGDDSVPWCDELIQFEWQPDRFGDLLKTMQDVQADVIYYPCIGMRLWSVIACNVRLAPLQIASLGHPATTHSSEIDFMVGGATTSGDDSCYSERLVRLKSPGNLYRLNRDQERFPREIRQRPVPVRVAVCANMLKLNADFLSACIEIANRAERSLEFCFMPNCIGVKYLVARQQVFSRLTQRARFRVVPRNRCSDYLQNLGLCDLYLSPFPFGGENSTLDALLQGLPAVTLAGKEPHSQLDARVLETAGLPEWLVTRSVREFVDVAVKLVNDDDLRVSISQQLLDNDLEKRFADEHQAYAGDFLQTIWSIYEESLAEQAAG